ncbi:hypothetical protein CQW23_06412 [Capsicum baccatum]|uniref:Uncharacterized protein n=1 Tax=Capsicum baccatum TaxID=33114 RepID=A0A2G2X3C1_CAPBA|nr:hypothetical protein CQW23_06412 [Capsicum baccatum]
MICGDFFGIPYECKTNLDLQRLESQLLEVIDGNTSLSYNSELNGSDLSKYMNFLRENLNDFMANNVGQFYLVVLVDAAESEDDIFNKPPYLLCLIVLVELEMKKIFLDFLLVFLDADVSNHVNNGNWLNEVMEKEIKQINAEVTVMWSANVALKPYYVVEPSKHLPSQHCNPVGDDADIVGFDIATEKVIRHPTQGTSELDVIPIVEIGE